MSKPALSPLLGKRVESWVRKDVLAEVLDIIVHETDIAININKIIAIEKNVIECKDDGSRCVTVYEVYLPSWKLWIRTEKLNGKTYTEWKFYPSD